MAKKVVMPVKKRMQLFRSPQPLFLHTVDGVTHRIHVFYFGKNKLKSLTISMMFISLGKGWSTKGFCEDVFQAPEVSAQHIE